MSAPAATSALATFSHPHAAAACNALRPRSSVASGSARADSRASTHRRCPQLDAARSGAASHSTAGGAAADVEGRACERSSDTASACPCKAASCRARRVSVQPALNSSFSRTWACPQRAASTTAAESSSADAAGRSSATASTLPAAATADSVVGMIRGCVDGRRAQRQNAASKEELCATFYSPRRPRRGAPEALNRPTPPACGGPIPRSLRPISLLVFMATRGTYLRPCYHALRQPVGAADRAMLLN